jgi:four helix bundle protein
VEGVSKAESGKRKGEGGLAMRMEGLRERTKRFALRVVRMYEKLPQNAAAQVIGKQVLRSGTSVAANFREASRARSDSEFAAKLGIVEQELDESMLWFELLIESGIVPKPKMQPLHQESEELLRIIVASIKRTKRRR